MGIVLEYVKDRAAAAHIWDYIRNRPDHALCGHPYTDPVVLEESGRPRAVCRACQELSPRAEATLWRAEAEELEEFSATYERLYEDLWKQYEELHRNFENLSRHSENQRAEIRNLRSKLKPGKPKTKRPPKPPPQVERRARIPGRVEFPHESPRKRPRVRLRG